MWVEGGGGAEGKGEVDCPEYRAGERVSDPMTLSQKSGIRRSAAPLTSRPSHPGTHCCSILNVRFIT